MSTIGPNNPGTAADGGGGGVYYPWTSASNAVSSNNVYATFAVSYNPSAVYSNDLILTNYEFGIPIGQKIDRIVVSIEGKSSHEDALNWTQYIILRLLKAGVPVGSNFGSPNCVSTIESTLDFEHPMDVVWTPADINASNFGVQLIVRIRSFDYTVTASIDVITLTVYYSLPTFVPRVIWM